VNEYESAGLKSPESMMGYWNCVLIGIQSEKHLSPYKYRPFLHLERACILVRADPQFRKVGQQEYFVYVLCSWIYLVSALVVV
jgi:hypothetical protein